VQELYICANPRWNVFCTTVSKAVHEELQRPLAEVAAVQPDLSPAPMIACFQPPPPTKNVLMNSGLKRWRHWMKNSAFSLNCVARSFEKFVKNDPEVSASEFGGIVIFNELAPEALTLESSTGAAAPERMMPELSPNPPAISAGESKPTHFRTPGCAHRVVKFALLGGGVGEEGAEVAAPSPEPPPPERYRGFRSFRSQRVQAGTDASSEDDTESLFQHEDPIIVYPLYVLV